MSIHLLAMAGCARLLGITVRRITFGMGPRIVAVGRVRLCLVPVGGHVQVATAADAPTGVPVHGALEGAARWKRVLLPLSGPLALFGLGMLLLGRPALDQFIHAFPQIVGGALSPLGKAQALLHAVPGALRSLSILQILGVVACKFAAFNVLPFLGSNGLAAATAWLAQTTRNGPLAQRFQAIVALPVALLLLAGWSLATVAFLVSR